MRHTKRLPPHIRKNSTPSCNIKSTVYVIFLLEMGTLLMRHQRGPKQSFAIKIAVDFSSSFIISITFMGFNHVSSSFIRMFRHLFITFGHMSCSSYFVVVSTFQRNPPCFMSSLAFIVLLKAMNCLIVNPDQLSIPLWSAWEAAGPLFLK